MNGGTTWLAAVPVGVAVVLGLLLAPRAPAPEGVPLPIPDLHAVARAAENDHRLADLARHEPLSGAVRALGSALRAFHSLEARDADAASLSQARRAVDAALVDALSGGTEPLAALRAVQLEAFLAEVQRFEDSGEESDELHAVAGGFVRSMRAEGWCDGRTFAADTGVLRVMFKQMWQHFLALDGREGLEPSLDEERLLYAFYLSHPHPSRSAREAIAAARRGARDTRACEALEFGERAAVEAWRLEHITRLAQIDPEYPADYARGISAYRRGELRASARAFGAWLEKHPEGPFSLRARNYLRAVTQAGQEP